VKSVTADHKKLKTEIISFIQNSPEEVNAKIAVFIAGMQAQKNLANCGQGKGNGLSVVKGVIRKE
jgi:citrate lyase synthetase